MSEPTTRAWGRRPGDPRHQLRERIRRRRLRRLLAAGAVDSFGLAVGWTVVTLHVLATHGLAGAALLNAAMLAGVALSAPVTTALSTRLSGRRLLSGASVGEALLRLAVFGLVMTGAPLWVLALVVVVQHVAAWTGFAVMRAEVVTTDARSPAMTTYLMTIAAVEAAGVAVAALLPADAQGVVRDTPATAVAVLYGCALLPTLLVARHARTEPATPLGGLRPGLRDATGWRRATPGVRPDLDASPRAAAGAGPLGGLRPGLRDATGAGRGGEFVALGAGALVMLLAAGPTLLSVGLASELHGRTAVALAAIAFTLGSLFAPMVSARLEGLALHPAVTWPLLGAGTVAGWAFAAAHPLGLMLAQLLSGLCLTTFEGTMDAAVGTRGRHVTGGLAGAAASRALGGAAATGLLPLAMAQVPLARVGSVATALLALVTVAGLAVTRARGSATWSLPPPSSGPPVPQPPALRPSSP